VLQSESDDFLAWTPYGVIMRPDEQDPPWDRQFYNMEWMPYEDVYLGFIAVYHILPAWNPRPPPAHRGWTRSIYNWHSAGWALVESGGHRQVFVPTGPTPDEFDWAMIYVMQHPIVVGDEIWIYYIGYAGVHWATRRNEVQGGAVGLARLRLDAFVSIDAGEGTLTTKRMMMSGDCLVVNADASLGSLAVEVMGADGEAVAGYGKAEADPITGDSVRHIATWNGSPFLRDLKGKPIALRFHLDRCKLYSFAFQAGE